MNMKQYKTIFTFILFYVNIYKVCYGNVNMFDLECCPIY